MYIKYNGASYPCTCRPASTMNYHGLPDDFPAPVTGEIVLCADDDFVIRTDTAEDYLRQTFKNGVLTLTNVIAVVTNEEEGIERSPSVAEQLRADVDYIAMITGVEL